MKKRRHVRAKTHVEVFRLFGISSLAKALSAAEDRIVAELGTQIRIHCSRMLDRYVREQKALGRKRKKR